MVRAKRRPPLVAVIDFKNRFFQNDNRARALIADVKLIKYPPILCAFLSGTSVYYPGYIGLLWEGVT